MSRGLLCWTRRMLPALIAGSLLVACAQHRSPEPEPSLAPRPIPLLQANPPPAAEQRLTIGVQVFTHDGTEQPALPINATTFKRIREFETHYLPVVLRQTLTRSQQWGPVRVLPQEDPSVDLLLRATIVASDGSTLTLAVQVEDSSGRIWLDQHYSREAHAGHYPDLLPATQQNRRGSHPDPFQDLYTEIANDIVLARMQQDTESLQELQWISELQHGRDLAPEAFADMLQRDEDGHLRVQRLPAANDPTRLRVEAMLERHDAFIDTVDDYYEALYRDVKPLYDVWRHYSWQYAVEQQRDGRGQRGARDGRQLDSFATLRRSYQRLQWAKLFEQEFVGLASGFVSETAPAVLELLQRISGLTGSVEEQYVEWRRLLRALYELDTGGPLPQLSVDGEP